MEGLEGDTEHAIADQLINEIKASEQDEDLWNAKVKVLAELVEHHIEEEEGELSKEIRKEFDAETRVQIGEDYTNLLLHHSGESNIALTKTNNQSQANMHRNAMAGSRN